MDIHTLPTPGTAPAAASSPIRFSALAAAKVGELVREDGNAALKLRVYISGGGCSGFQYRFELVETAEDDDLRIQADGQAALIDPVSIPFLKGSEIAYVDELAGAQFVVSNPNAASSCGCGVSFAI